MSAPRTKQLDEKFCSDCGEVIKIKAEICPNCGIRQRKKELSINVGKKAANGKSRLVAALFAFPLGLFGTHKFYLGSPGLGVLYLLFFWTWIPTIVGLIEAILFLNMSDEEFDLRYGQT